MSTCRGVTNTNLKSIYINNNKPTKTLSRSDQVEEITSCGFTTKNGIPSTGACPQKPAKPAQVADIALSTDKQPEEDLSAGSGTRKNLESREKVTETAEEPPTILEATQESHERKWNPTGPSEKTTKQSSFMERVKHVLRFPISPISAPPFNCQLSETAAEENLKLLENNEMSIGKVIKNSPFSPMSLGSEFKAVEILEPLMKRLPSWPTLRDSLKLGASCPIRQLDADTLARDFAEGLKQGNNKSAEDECEWVGQQFKNEVNRGWTLALPLRAAAKFTGGVYAPLGVVLQDTINEFGDIVPKKRLVHNMSKEGKISKCSANSRTIDEELESVSYGFCHRRVIHCIVKLRQENPTQKILLCKADFKSAYRRKHSAWEAIMLSLTSIKFENFDYLLASLRLTFGGTFCVSQWCLTSEAITDLANALLQCPDWDHHNLQSRWSHLVPKPVRLKNCIPLEKSRQMSVNVPCASKGQIDCFIDDLPGVALDTEDNIERLPGSILLAMDLFTRQYSNYPLPRDEMVSITKLTAELGLAETKIILGWHYDTRRLTISLPTDKYVAWSAQLNKLLLKKQTNHNELKTLIGRLDHTSSVMPLARHFMERLRFAKEKTSDRPNMPYTLNRTCLSDIRIMKKILDKAQAGISMNLLTYRSPDAQYKVDACPKGMGGFSKTGRAWRLELPQHLRGRAHINLLEFIASLVSIWIDIAEQNTKPFDCLLAMGDSTTAIGWLQMGENMAVDDFQARTKVARKLASLMIDNDMYLYSQWFAGKTKRKSRLPEQGL